MSRFTRVKFNKLDSKITNNNNKNVNVASDIKTGVKTNVDVDTKILPSLTRSTTCQAKDCKQPAMSHCRRCLNISYCSRQCQLKDWPQHGFDCLIPEKRAAIKKADDYLEKFAHDKVQHQNILNDILFGGLAEDGLKNYSTVGNNDANKQDAKSTVIVKGVIEFNLDMVLPLMLTSQDKQEIGKLINKRAGTDSKLLNQLDIKPTLSKYIPHTYFRDKPLYENVVRLLDKYDPQTEFIVLIIVPFTDRKGQQSMYHDEKIIKVFNKSEQKAKF